MNIKRLVLALFLAATGCQLHVMHANPSANIVKNPIENLVSQGIIGSKGEVLNTKIALKAWAYRHRVSLAVAGCALVYCSGMIVAHKPKTVSEALGIVSLHVSSALKDAYFFKA